jgi:two-component system, LytTR family, sensor kinase
MYLPLFMIRPKLFSFIAHATGWILFFSLMIAFVSGSPGRQNISARIFSPAFLLFCFIYLFLFYFNTYVLIPWLYLQKKYLLYFSIILVLFAGAFFLKPYDRLLGSGSHPPERLMMQSSSNPEMRPTPGIHKPIRTDIVSIVLFVTVWSLSTAICINRQWRITQKKVTQAEADKANAELSFLKAQINPHFLFNTLNNIYSLAVTNNENTAASIMKLSNIMRYVTDDIKDDYVSLENEIQCMTDYIDLQRLRLGKKMNVDFVVTGNTENKRIAPLILMTFIENVFKYGISNHESSAITIKLAVEEHTITFFCQNKLFDTKRNIERTGIGIANTKQRLAHLYPDKHFLNINKENGLYSVQLTLQV